MAGTIEKFQFLRASASFVKWAQQEKREEKEEERWRRNHNRWNHSYGGCYSPSSSLPNRQPSPNPTACIIAYVSFSGCYSWTDLPLSVSTRQPSTDHWPTAHTKSMSVSGKVFYLQWAHAITDPSPRHKQFFIVTPTVWLFLRVDTLHTKQWRSAIFCSGWNYFVHIRGYFANPRASLKWWIITIIVMMYLCGWKYLPSSMKMRTDTSINAIILSILPTNMGIWTNPSKY